MRPHAASTVRHLLVLATALTVAFTSACGVDLGTMFGQSPSATAVDGTFPVQVVGFTQVGNSLSVRLHNPSSEVGLIRSPFELALIDRAGAVIATEGQGGLPGTVVNTIYQLPPGGEYGLDDISVPGGRTVASVELTILGKWFKWSTVHASTVSTSDVALSPDDGYSGPSATGRLTLDGGAPANVIVLAFVNTPAGTVVSRVLADCVQSGQRRTFQTRTISDVRGPYVLDRVVAYATSVKDAGPQYDPGCAGASAQQPPPATSVPTRASSTSPASTTSPTPPAHASTSDVSGAGSGGSGKLTAVRLGPRDGYDRLVLEFLDGVPKYTIGYRPLPARADGSGLEIPLPGANALVQITLSGATGSGWGGGPRTYFGPSTVTAATANVTDAKEAGDFEAVLNWVVGLRSVVPFRVAVLDGPARLVVDFDA